MTNPPMFQCQRGHEIFFEASKINSLFNGCPRCPVGLELFYGCDLIFARTWTLDDLMLGELEVHDRSCEFCIGINGKEQKPKSSWQPSNLSVSSFQTAKSSLEPKPEVK